MLNKKGLTWSTESSSHVHTWCSRDTGGICREVAECRISLLDHLFHLQDLLRRKNQRWLVLPEMNLGAVLQLNIPLELC